MQAAPINIATFSGKEVAWHFVGEPSKNHTAPNIAPLGSLWKLFVSTYLSAQKIKAAHFQCTGKAREFSEEVYCCDKGQSIGQDEALARSCSLYFSPDRLKIRPIDWAIFWQKEVPNAPRWLTELSQMQAHIQVPIEELLQVLYAFSGKTKDAAITDFSRVNVHPRSQTLLSHTGNTLWVKTWSWFEKDAKGRKIQKGGFAGWQQDGQTIWVGGEGTSQTVIAKLLPDLEAVLLEGRANTLPENECVTVSFFTRYPLKEVLQNGQSTKEGPLRGKIEARFQNNQTLVFQSEGALTLTKTARDALKIEGRFGLNDYVARVLMREGSTKPKEAARALAVAARTYLIAHAGFRNGCYEITDESATQRVSPNFPSKDALAAATFSHRLILNGATGRYHATKAKVGQLSWQNAIEEARSGLRWDAILKSAYGGAGLLLLGEDARSECKPLKEAQHWLQNALPRFEKVLAKEEGYESPEPLPAVCDLAYGNPYADLERGRIYATGVKTVNERMSLVHEFLHFAFAYHPKGRDEVLIETMAKRLLKL